MVEKVKCITFAIIQELLEMIDPRELNALIRQRRSTFVSQFIPGQKIPDDIIWQLLENANRAPNHGQTEPWRFNVFAGEGLQTLATFQANLYRTNAGQNFKEDKFHKLLTTPLKCSHVISLGMKRNLGKIPEIEEVEAVACAVQNIYLTMTAYEIGGYWTTGGITYYETAKNFFGLGEADKLLGFFYLGYVASQSPLSRRLPIKEKVTWVSY